MNFKSQIATNINQSWKLLNLGLKPCTADMYLEKSKTPEYGEYHLHTICEGIDPEHWFSVRMNRDITPSWSLDRLLEIMPNHIDNYVLMYNRDYHSLTSDSVYIAYDSLHIPGEYMHKIDSCNNSYESCIEMIEWLIHNNHLNKEYLKERL